MYAQAETELGPSCFQEVDLVLLFPDPQWLSVQQGIFFLGVG